MRMLYLIVALVCIHAFSYSQDTLNRRDENSKKIGKWIEYFPNEKEFEYAVINYVDGLRQGEFKAYLKDSTMYIQGSFFNDKLHGEHFTYYKTGELNMQTFYLNGKENGTRTTYYEDGVKYSETEYKNNRKDGAYTCYYSSGNIKRQGQYLNEEKSGIWKEFSENGTLTNTTNH